MTVLASTATMMTMVYAVQDAAVAGAVTGQEMFSGDIRVQTTWEVDPVKAVLGLEHLSPNWDGYGSGAVTRETANLAISLVGQIASLGFGDLPAPHVGPIVNGGVAFEWTRGGRQLSFSVFPDRTIEFLKCDAGEPFEEARVAPSMTGRLRALVSWLLSAPALAA